MILQDSIHTRLTLATLLILALFLGLVGYLLQTAQRHSLLAAIEAQLLGHVYGLLGEAKLDDAGRVGLPHLVADPRLNQPDSGFYAELKAAPGQGIEVGKVKRDGDWRSASMVGRPNQAMEIPDAGQQRFYQDSEGYRLLYGFEWEDAMGGVRHYGLRITLSATLAEQRETTFHNTLWGGLIALGLFLLLLQGLLLRWGLRPLRQVAEALKAIESGRAGLLQGRYPVELRLLTDNINSLIEHNHIQQARYRNSLDDLAHSIKTPLAVLQGALDSEQPDRLREAALQAVPHIDDIVRGRLQRAALGGREPLAKPVDLGALAQRLIRTLEKVYWERDLLIECDLPKHAHIGGDESDFMELLGNLLDNACKYAHKKVRISGAMIASGGWRLSIEDDGPGIPEAERKAVLERGGRADENRPGQGIGLAAVHEIVRLYKGELALGKSPILGGAAITLTLPGIHKLLE